MPMTMGTATPHRATKKPDFPALRSSRRSVPMPAVKRMTITPISLSWERKAVSDSTFSMAGPSTRPASREPTTLGI